MKKFDPYYFDIQKLIEEKYFLGSHQSKAILGKWQTASEIAHSIEIQKITQVETRIISDIFRLAYKGKSQRIKRTSRGVLFYTKSM